RRRRLWVLAGLGCDPIASFDSVGQIEGAGGRRRACQSRPVAMIKELQNRSRPGAPRGWATGVLSSLAAPCERPEERVERTLPRRRCVRTATNGCGPRTAATRRRGGRRRFATDRPY